MKSIHEILLGVLLVLHKTELLCNLACTFTQQSCLVLRRYISSSLCEARWRVFPSMSQVLFYHLRVHFADSCKMQVVLIFTSKFMKRKRKKSPLRVSKHTLRAHWRVCRKFEHKCKSGECLWFWSLQAIASLNSSTSCHLKPIVKDVLELEAFKRTSSRQNCAKIHETLISMPRWPVQKAKQRTSRWNIKWTRYFSKNFDHCD